MRGGPSGRGLLPPPHPLPPAPRLDTVQAGEPSASDRWRDAKVQACASTPEGQSLVPFVASALQRLQKTGDAAGLQQALDDLHDSVAGAAPLSMSRGALSSLLTEALGSSAAHWLPALGVSASAEGSVVSLLRFVREGLASGHLPHADSLWRLMAPAALHVNVATPLTMPATGAVKKLLTFDAPVSAAALSLVAGEWLAGGAASTHSLAMEGLATVALSAPSTPLPPGSVVASGCSKHLLVSTDAEGACVVAGDLPPAQLPQSTAGDACQWAVVDSAMGATGDTWALLTHTATDGHTRQACLALWRAGGAAPAVHLLPESAWRHPALAPGGEAAGPTCLLPLTPLHAMLLLPPPSDEYLPALQVVQVGAGQASAVGGPLPLHPTLHRACADLMGPCSGAWAHMRLLVDPPTGQLSMLLPCGEGRVCSRWGVLTCPSHPCLAAATAPAQTSGPLAAPLTALALMAQHAALTLRFGALRGPEQVQAADFAVPPARTGKGREVDTSSANSAEGASNPGESPPREAPADPRPALVKLEHTYQGGSSGWSAPGWVLLGARIAVLWAGDRYYKGTVVKFDAAQKRHFVVYDDGDQRWYTMRDKTFRVLSLPQLSREESEHLEEVRQEAEAIALSLQEEEVGQAEQEEASTAPSEARVPLLPAWDQGGAGTPPASPTHSGQPHLPPHVSAWLSQSVGDAEQPFNPDLRSWEPFCLDLDCRGEVAALASDLLSGLVATGSPDASVTLLGTLDQPLAKPLVHLDPAVASHAAGQVLALVSLFDTAWRASGASSDFLQPGLRMDAGKAVGSAAAESDPGEPRLITDDEAGESKASPRSSPTAVPAAFLEALPQAMSVRQASDQFNKAVKMLETGKLAEGAVAYLHLLAAHAPSVESTFNLACAFSLLSARPASPWPADTLQQLALRWLRLSESLGMSGPSLVTGDADLRPLHGHPAFDELTGFSSAMQHVRGAMLQAGAAGPHTMLPSPWCPPVRPPLLLGQHSLDAEPWRGWQVELHHVWALSAALLAPQHLGAAANAEALVELVPGAGAPPPAGASSPGVTDQSACPPHLPWLWQCLTDIALMPGVDPALQAAAISALAAVVPGGLRSTGLTAISTLTSHILSQTSPSVPLLLRKLLQVPVFQETTGRTVPLSAVLAASAHGPSMLRALWEGCVTPPPSQLTVGAQGTGTAPPLSSSAVDSGSVALIAQLQGEVLADPSALSGEGGSPPPQPGKPAPPPTAPPLARARQYLHLVLTCTGQGAGPRLTLEDSGLARLLRHAVHFLATHARRLVAARSADEPPLVACTSHLLQNLTARASALSPAGQRRLLGVVPALALACRRLAESPDPRLRPSPLETRLNCFTACWGAVHLLGDVTGADADSLPAACAALLQVEEAAAPDALKALLAPLASKGVRPPLLPPSLRSLHASATLAALAALAARCTPAEARPEGTRWLATPAQLDSDSPGLDAFASLARTSLQVGQWCMRRAQAARALPLMAAWAGRGEGGSFLEHCQVLARWLQGDASVQGQLPEEVKEAVQSGGGGGSVLEALCLTPPVLAALKGGSRSAGILHALETSCATATAPYLPSSLADADVGKESAASALCRVLVQVDVDFAGAPLAAVRERARLLCACSGGAVLASQDGVERFLSSPCIPTLVPALAVEPTPSSHPHLMPDICRRHSARVAHAKERHSAIAACLPQLLAAWQGGDATASAAGLAALPTMLAALAGSTELARQPDVGLVFSGDVVDQEVPAPEAMPGSMSLDGFAPRQTTHLQQDNAAHCLDLLQACSTQLQRRGPVPPAVLLAALQALPAATAQLADSPDSPRSVPVLVSLRDALLLGFARGTAGSPLVGAFQQVLVCLDAALSAAASVDAPSTVVQAALQACSAAAGARLALLEPAAQAARTTSAGATAADADRKEEEVELGETESKDAGQGPGPGRGPVLTASDHAAWLAAESCLWLDLAFAVGRAREGAQVSESLLQGLLQALTSPALHSPTGPPGDVPAHHSGSASKAHPLLSPRVRLLGLRLLELCLPHVPPSAVGDAVPGLLGLARSVSELCLTQAGAWPCYEVRGSGGSSTAWLWRAVQGALQGLVATCGRSWAMTAPQHMLTAVPATAPPVQPFPAVPPPTPMPASGIASGSASNSVAIALSSHAGITAAQDILEALAKASPVSGSGGGSGSGGSAREALLRRLPFGSGADGMLGDLLRRVIGREGGSSPTGTREGSAQAGGMLGLRESLAYYATSWGIPSDAPLNLPLFTEHVPGGSVSCALTLVLRLTAGEGGAPPVPCICPAVVWTAQSSTMTPLLVSLQHKLGVTHTPAVHSLLTTAEPVAPLAAVVLDAQQAGRRVHRLHVPGARTSSQPAAILRCDALPVARALLGMDGAAEMPLRTVWQVREVGQLAGGFSALKTLLPTPLPSGTYLASPTGTQGGKSAAQGGRGGGSARARPSARPAHDRVAAATQTELRRILIARLAREYPDVAGSGGDEGGAGHSAPPEATQLNPQAAMLARMLGIPPALASRLQPAAGGARGSGFPGSSLLGALHGPESRLLAAMTGAPAPAQPQGAPHSTPGSTSGGTVDLDRADALAELAQDEFTLDGGTASPSRSTHSGGSEEPSSRSLLPGSRPNAPHSVILRIPMTGSRRHQLDALAALATRALKSSDFPSTALDTLRVSLGRQLQASVDAGKDVATAVVASGPLALCHSIAVELARTGLLADLQPMASIAPPSAALALNEPGADAAAAVRLVPWGDGGHALEELGAVADILAALSHATAWEEQGISDVVLGQAEAGVPSALACLGGHPSVLGALRANQVVRLLPTTMTLDPDTAHAMPAGGRVEPEVWLDNPRNMRVWRRGVDAGEDSLGLTHALGGALVRLVRRLPSGGILVAVERSTAPATHGVVLEVAQRHLAPLPSPAARHMQGLSVSGVGSVPSPTLQHMSCVRLGSAGRVSSALHTAIAAVESGRPARLLPGAFALATLLVGGAVQPAHLTEAMAGAPALHSALRALATLPAPSWASALPPTSGQASAALAAAASWQALQVWRDGGGEGGTSPSLQPLTPSAEAAATAALTDLPLALDPTCLCHSVQLLPPEAATASSGLPTWPPSTPRTSPAVRFCGFQPVKVDPRRGERAPHRVSDDFVFRTAKPWPMSGPVWGHRRFLYFEVGVTHAERGTEAPAPQVMAGLWVNTPGGVGAGDTGCTWGPGCIAYSGSDGRLARWRAVVPDSLLTPTAEAGPSVTHTTSPCLGPAAAPGAPTTDSTPSAIPEQTAPPTTVGGIAFEVGAMVDVKDLHSEPTWRPGIIQAVQGDDVKVHYLGWDASWDETLPRSSERLAPPGSHSRGATPTGYMQRLPYGSVWGQRGDTVGVLLDRATATLAFTLNGVYQGVAARGVRGRFHPAFSTTNPSATLCLNTGGLPFVWPDAPPPLGEQPTPSAHAEALAALPQPEPEDEAFEAAEAAAHAVLLASAEEAEAQAQAAAQAARSRPVAYPHAKRRNTAMELKEMMPPELRVELVMRVLASAHDSREQAAEFLLMRGGSMLGATAQADALADEEAQRYKNCTFLEASYTNSARTSHLLPHTLSGFGGVPPPAPGMALPVVAAEPLQADEPLVNAEEVAGKWALVHRGACTFVTKMRHAQAAGAAGVILVNSEGSEPFIANAGTENVANLTIPMLLVSHAKGTALQADAEGDSGLVVTARVGLRPPPAGATSSVRADPVADTGAAAPGSAVDSPSGTAESASPPPSKAAPLALEECIHHTGYGCGPEGPLVLGSVASREAADACLGREPGQVGPHWTPSADAVVHPQAPVGALSRYAASLLDADAVLAGQGAGVPAADGGTAGLQVGDAGTAAGPGRAGAASEQSAVDAWVANVQNQMARRRVPGGMVTMVTGMLREGGENQMAMARSMLADIGITLPPRPETETAQAAGAGRSPRLGPSPLAGPALLPSLSRIPSVDSPVMSPRMTPQLAGRTSSQGAEAPELTRGQSHDASGGDGMAGGLDSVVYGRTSSANPSAGLDISKAFPGQAVMLSVCSDAAALGRLAAHLRRLLAQERFPQAQARDKPDALAEGMRVRARWFGGGWYDGVIASVVPATPASTPAGADAAHGFLYDVDFDDGDAEANIPIDRIRIRPAGTQAWLPAASAVKASKQGATGVVVAPLDPVKALAAAAPSHSLTAQLQALEPGHMPSWSVGLQRFVGTSGTVLETKQSHAAVRVLFTDPGGEAVAMWVPATLLTALPQPHVVNALGNAHKASPRFALEAAAAGAASAVGRMLLLSLPAPTHQETQDSATSVAAAAFSGVGWHGAVHRRVAGGILQQVLPSVVRAAAADPAWLPAMLRDCTDEMVAGTQQHCISAPKGDSSAGALRCGPASSPLAGWFVHFGVRGVTGSSTDVPTALAALLPEGAAIVIESDDTVHHAGGRVADVLPHLASAQGWVPDGQAGSQALRSMGLRGGGTAGPGARDATHAGVLDTCASIVLRGRVVTVQVRLADGSPADDASGGDAKGSLIAAAVPIPTALPFVLAAVHRLAADTHGVDCAQAALNLAVELLASAAKPGMPGDIAADFVDGAAALLHAAAPVAALEAPGLAHAVHGLFPMAASAMQAHGTQVALPLKLTSDSAELTSSLDDLHAHVRILKNAAWLTTVPRFAQAVFRSVQALEPVLAQPHPSAVHGLLATTQALVRGAGQVLGWLGGSSGVGEAPAWLLRTAWTSAHDTWHRVVTAMGPEAAAKLSRPTPSAAADVEVGDAAPGRGVREVGTPTVQAGQPQPPPSTDNLQAAAKALFSDWPAEADAALLQWAASRSASKRTASAGGSAASGDGAATSPGTDELPGLVLPFSVFTGLAEAPAGLPTASAAVLHARYALLSTATAVVFATVPLVVPDKDCAWWTPAKQLTSALARLVPGTLSVWLQKALRDTACSTGSVRPRVTLNRFKTSSGDGSAGDIWQQLVTGLLKCAPSPAQLRQVREAPHLGFEVKLTSERVVGDLGPYREILDDVGREVGPASAGGTGASGWFMPTPNASGAYGEFRDCVMPGPGCILAGRLPEVWASKAPSDATGAALLAGLGSLLGVAVRTGCQVPIPLPPAIWQVLSGGSFSGMHSLSGMHAYLVDSVLHPLSEAAPAGLDAAGSASDAFAATFGDDLPLEVDIFGTGLSARFLSRDVAAPEVLSAELAGPYAFWVQGVHFAALHAGTQALRAGLHSILPKGVTVWSAASGLSVAVAGSPDVDVDMLARHTQYAGGATATSPHIKAFWRVLREDFTPEQRRRFVKFAWGQSRLPPSDAAWEAGGLRLLIKSPASASRARGRNIDGRLPRADTCFFNVELPPYSSYEVMRRQLNVVVSLDAGLDGDVV